MISTLIILGATTLAGVFGFYVGLVILSNKIDRLDTRIHEFSGDFHKYSESTPGTIRVNCDPSKMTISALKQLIDNKQAIADRLLQGVNTNYGYSNVDLEKYDTMIAEIAALTSIMESKSENYKDLKEVIS